MEALLTALMVWVSSVTGYPPADSLPRIALSTPCDLYEMAVGADCPEDDEILIRGVYDHHSDTIHLREGWEPDNLHDIAVLVHEMVHHLQNHAGMDMVPKNDPCSGQKLEKPAYQAQIRWLMSTGLDFDQSLAVMGTNRLFLLMVTSCNHNRL